MKKINEEKLISSLLVLGFERIDPVLYTLSLGSLNEFDDNKNFTFVSSEFSERFKRVVCLKNGSYSLKDGLNLDSNTLVIPNRYYSVRDYLMIKCGSADLVGYLSKVDFENIVMRKVNMLGIDRLNNNIDEVFCQKEKEIIRRIYCKESFQKNNAKRYTLSQTIPNK